MSKRILPISSIINKNKLNNNRYISGSGIGSNNISVRRSKYNRSSNCKNCDDNNYSLNLKYYIYNGYFGGTNSDTNIVWFNPIDRLILNNGRTDNLYNLNTITNYKYNNYSNISISIYITGYFKVNQTGVYTFYTRSNETSFLYINDIPIILNGGIHNIQTVYTNVNLVQGIYYKLDAYFGQNSGGLNYYFTVGYIEPSYFLTYQLYQDYYNGDISWFNTATLISNGQTRDLLNLSKITNNDILINSSIAQSIKVNGFFRAQTTGSYRFFTGGNGKYILEIDGDDIIVKNTLVNEDSFANKSLIAGNYYSFNLYYGTPSFYYPPIPFPSSTNSTVNTLTATGQLYGNGTYVARVSNTGSGFPFNAVDKDVFTRWRSANAYPNPTRTTITNSGDINGEWFQIQLPNAIVLDKFYLRTRDTTPSIRPKGIVMLGSNTGVNDWNVLYSSDNIGFIPIFENIFYIDVEPQSYSFYRFIATSTNGGSYYEIWELELYDKPILSSGYLEPLEDGTNTGSINPDDFINIIPGINIFND